jgi:hypothetical protein
LKPSKVICPKTIHAGYTTKNIVPAQKATAATIAARALHNPVQSHVRLIRVAVVPHRHAAGPVVPHHPRIIARVTVNLSKNVYAHLHLAAKAAVKTPTTSKALVSTDLYPQTTR